MGPWFSGLMEDLPRLRLKWEAYVGKHYTNSPDKVLIQLMHRYCISVEIGMVIEDARDLV
jgi:hypothetical protein